MRVVKRPGSQVQRFSVVVHPWTASLPVTGNRSISPISAGGPRQIQPEHQRGRICAVPPPPPLLLLLLPAPWDRRCVDPAFPSLPHYIPRPSACVPCTLSCAGELTVGHMHARGYAWGWLASRRRVRPGRVWWGFFPRVQEVSVRYIAFPCPSPGLGAVLFSTLVSCSQLSFSP